MPIGNERTTTKPNKPLTPDEARGKFNTAFQALSAASGQVIETVMGTNRNPIISIGFDARTRRCIPAALVEYIEEFYQRTSLAIAGVDVGLHFWSSILNNHPVSGYESRAKILVTNLQPVNEYERAHPGRFVFPHDEHALGDEVTLFISRDQMRASARRYLLSQPGEAPESIARPFEDDLDPTIVGALAELMDIAQHLRFIRPFQPVQPVQPRGRVRGWVSKVRQMLPGGVPEPLDFYPNIVTYSEEPGG
ncbi:hypothetical protein A2631_05680 [Candidatus Daviesbacteria bacterium RIFCSPHIGHO2_01_FULL_44_29]|uniref:Uncharacterized protein n=1 Tax=Candidatus Daviesbacteria bacterium RIFCSPHIGHO2_02_FULL_43_12 TaxID=1797776 RepID=A0A1F5KI69_9BACT|nr:MAG: hypothetical protein A2631_05680 [Candidatus Daviesbacteria bacterium RIFCSPHIGHO2_01_FULL_44_29]OGE39703.1 MAG: hypothetical protein A3E86_00195 [Candidatus Daviesbacteria bacterium RIFCSPHIGHO2_12_FULL_47_45]OGE40657.1 MAG: hypothetical protein A3D25_05875 [Candidatus Daviesbacteria bacterium RIFCSPHIGHO2_02_FULL_43_12]OGE69847.1 MAG: hypothetical protein A3B55_05555 [Candidatus Daviesbacteria bacterium RIFCSPLOWO2_01_FULL_43_15]